MKQVDIVYDYLKNNYKYNEPIFLSEIAVPRIKEVSVRQQLKKLTEDGRIKRFDTGIYYIPRKSMFKSGSVLSVDEVIKKKYLTDGDARCGYICGIMFANRLGLTTQVPMVYEVCTNKATTEYRNVQLGNFRVIVRRPYAKINEENVVVLQFLDLMREVTDVSEVEGEELTVRLLAYLNAKNIKFDAFKPYLSFYPERIYKNMFEVGLLNGTAT